MQVIYEEHSICDVLRVTIQEAEIKGLQIAEILLKKEELENFAHCLWDDTFFHEDLDPCSITSLANKELEVVEFQGIKFKLALIKE